VISSCHDGCRSESWIRVFERDGKRDRVDVILRSGSEGEEARGAVR
jgi:hypothetical protein